MKKNSFLERQQELNNEYLNIGISIGFQKCWDYVQIALRCSDTVGRDIFGIGRIRKLAKKVKALDQEFDKAFAECKEADVLQEHLDKLIAEIYKDEAHSFYQRYPNIKRLNPNKKWK